MLAGSQYMARLRRPLPVDVRTEAAWGLARADSAKGHREVVIDRPSMYQALPPSVYQS